MSSFGEKTQDPLYTRVTLLKKTKNPSDEMAWADFTAYYRKYIYNFARRMGLAHHDADEVVQITLLKIWNAMPKFQYKPQRGRFRSWICKVTGNAAKNYLRSKGPVPLSISGINWDSTDADEFSVQPEVEKIAKEEWERYLPELALKNVERHFDRKTIQVFRLLSKGLSAAEIAGKTGLAESSVYVYKQRVLSKVTEELAILKEKL